MLNQKERSAMTHAAITFYAEPEGNIVAVFGGTRRGDMQDALASLYDDANSPVASTVVCDGYLRRCTRVPEAIARTMHPAMFARLDDAS